MELDKIREIHTELCALSIDLSRQILEMGFDNPLYRQANKLADDVQAAASSAYLLLKIARGD